jgi:hypothetical protein
MQIFVTSINDAPCHKLINLNNVGLEYLPPYCADILYLDAGNIKSSNGHYWWHQVRKIVQYINTTTTSELSLKDACI